MRLSARNVIKGTVTEVTKGAVAAEVQVDIGGGNTITSLITVGSARASESQWARRSAW